MILSLDHVGIAVREGDSAAAAFSRLTGWPSGALESVAGQAVRVCFLPDSPDPTHPPDPAPAHAQSGARLELLQPESDESAVGRFLARRGEGLHHVCFAVDDLTAEIARLVGEGFEAIDAAPRRGHGGLVAFLHPRSAHGVLVELLQRDPPREGRT
jgi:methylmalonyl-CoA/ethylmalonyl-CoA epimerase